MSPPLPRPLIVEEEEAGTDVFVARQPIFWADQRVMGYELLYRGSRWATRAEGRSLEAMSSAVLVNALLAIGLKDITGGRVAFLNLPEDLLHSDIADLLDPSEVVIELHESIRPSPQVVTVCRYLMEKGFVLALDDFEFREEILPLLELVQVVKLEVVGRSREELEVAVRRLAPYKVQLLAEKVETAHMHALCCELGFELFQGFFYLHPETLTRRDLATESVTVVRLLNLLQDFNITDRAVEEAFRVDPGLSYKLLRMVNSAALGGRGVTSIEHALRLLGREPLYRWLSMLLVADHGDGTGTRSELIKSSLLRGRFCELLGDEIRGAEVRGVPLGGTLFLIGLFSRIDALLRMPMTGVLEKIHLSEAVRDALLERKGVGGIFLKAVEAYEAAEWEKAEEELTPLGVPPHTLPNLYLESLAWAGDRMQLQAG